MIRKSRRNTYFGIKLGVAGSDSFRSPSNASKIGTNWFKGSHNPSQFANLEETISNEEQSQDEDEKQAVELKRQNDDKSQVQGSKEESLAEQNE